MTKGAAAVVGLLALGACGSQVTRGADAPSHTDGGVAAMQPKAAPQAAVPEAANGAEYDTALDSRSARQVSAKAPAPELGKRELIYTGQVALRSRDVAGAAAGVRTVATRYGGRIDDEQTEAASGKVSQETLTVRVPSGRFMAAFDAIKQLGTLRSASSSAQDVTTQVIDVRVRVRAQKASLHRIEQLMSRASTLGQVIALESQLTQRQSALDALEQKQAYLKDQTTMSTITVDVDRTRTAPAGTKPAHHRTGFLGGLHRGWHALTVSATAVAAGFGAVLPFGIPLLVLGVPAWLALRRRRRTAPTPAP
ncbi:MAG TPA: DUF4349 domain-containing protein [Nocardioides sp.]|nr:DUF4349 domain-containing protein [Nocardioides sp.]